MSLSLNKIFAHAGRDLLIRELTLDSRNVRAGDLFLAVPGGKFDGRAHIADALQRGAAAVAYEVEGATVLPITDVPLIPVKGLAAQLSDIAGRFYGDPSRHLNLIGVTGTNGKTSVTQLVAQALDLLGQHCGIVGTLGTGFYGALESGLHTTPNPIAVQATLADLKKAGAKAVAMEVSSHGLDQGRVTALAFDVAVMTNLSRDHLDYHGTMQAYGEAKAKLFTWNDLKCRVVNLDDEFGRQLAADKRESRLITYSLEDASAYLYCREAQFDDEGVRATLVTPQGGASLAQHLARSLQPEQRAGRGRCLAGAGLRAGRNPQRVAETRRPGRTHAAPRRRYSAAGRGRLRPHPGCAGKSLDGPASSRQRPFAVPVRLRW